MEADAPGGFRQLRKVMRRPGVSPHVGDDGQPAVIVEAIEALFEEKT